jgi:hypothetical protein
LLFRILETLFSEREAELVAQIPLKLFTAHQAAKIWEIAESEARNVLEGLASRVVLLDTETPSGEILYVSCPAAHWLFRVFDDAIARRHDQKAFAALYYQYSPSKTMSSARCLRRSRRMG